MNEQNALVIRKLSKTKPLQHTLFGEFIASEWFVMEQRALLLSPKGVFVLGRSRDDAYETVLMLTELLSLLRYMEENHIIFVMEHRQFDEINLFYQSCHDMKMLQDGCHYDLGNAYLLYIQDENIQIQDKLQRPVLSDRVDVSALREDVIHYLFSYVYPTASLSKFIEHDFLTENDYHTRESVRLSRFSLWIAVFVAAISPFFSLWMGNRWGVTKLDEQQLRKLTEKCLGSAASITTSDHQHEQDTIKPLSGH